MRWYGALDLLFATLYLYVGLVIAPSRSRAFDVALWVVCGLLIAAGAGLLLERRWARLLGIISATVLLAFAAVVMVLLCASAAYLHGVYGALGRGLSIMTLVCAALVLQFFALLPLFQLRYLLKR
jgi:hypothetical protein